MTAHTPEMPVSGEHPSPTPVPLVAEAAPPPRFRVAAASLAAALPTAMLLVDYALAGKATPTPAPQAVAQWLGGLAEESAGLRAVLAHGSVLRTVLMAQLPPDHPAHADFDALRGWFAGLSDDRILGLVEYGAGSVLDYGTPLERRRGVRERDVAGLRGGLEALQTAVLEVLKGWPVPDPAGRAPELLDPRFVRTTLLRLLDAVWELWYATAWDGLPAVVPPSSAPRRPSPDTTGAQWIAQVTGLRPDPQYADAADRAHALAVMPCPGLGRSLSLFDSAGETFVLFTPAAVSDDDPPARTGISVGRLGQLAPAMQALGDRTRLALVLYLAERGPVPMQELADAVQVHQSTVSRQVAALRKAGIVTLDTDRRVVLDRESVRRACHTLLEATEERPIRWPSS